jgi:quercetin dioxygenase-like cupin family protein
MNSRILFVAGLLAASAPIAGFGQQTEVVVTPVEVTGDVIRYEPGRTIVLKADGREVSYVLTPELTIPAEVQLGRRVTVHSERGADGTARVTRVVTTSLTPDGQVQRTTEETRVGDSGMVTQKKTTVTGEVVSFVPGKSIVVRRSPGDDVSMLLAGNVQLPPAEVQVGQRVTLFTEPGIDGTTTVSRITTTSVTAAGEAKRTVEETRTSPTGETTKTTTVTVQGKVKTYEPGKSFTILKADGSAVTYKIAENANMPADLAVGKVVTIHTVPGSGLRIVVEKDQ